MVGKTGLFHRGAVHIQTSVSGEKYPTEVYWYTSSIKRSLHPMHAHDHEPNLPPSRPVPRLPVRVRRPAFPLAFSVLCCPATRTKKMTLALKDREEFTLGSLTVTALHTPCHTRGHVLFYVASSASASAAAAAGEWEGEGDNEEAAAPLVFSGDTLFVGGCGRFFEGDASQSKCSWREGCGVV